jgi:hypothetical protein
MTSPVSGWGGGLQWKLATNVPSQFISDDATPILFPLFSLPDNNTLGACVIYASGINPADGGDSYTVWGIAQAFRNFAGVLNLNLTLAINLTSGAVPGFNIAEVDGVINFVLIPPAIVGYRHKVVCMDKQTLL